jgi:hypothetical protein
MSRDDASWLTDTSIEDMKSSLDCAESEGQPYSVNILKQALATVTRRGEKTKARILETRIRKYERGGMR